ncbi:MAG: nucleotide exchange factor GrpE [Coriobacteriia bacterium]|nr:nucleotide exchange factor GrpE [Coriobacteriia bacterium]
MTTNKSHQHETEAVAESAAASAKAQKAAEKVKTQEAAQAAEDVHTSKQAAADASTAGEVEMSEVEILLEQVSTWRDTAMRAQAEFENTKKRLQAQQAVAVARAGERVITNLIPILDDIDLALTHAKESQNDMADGLAAIRSKMDALLGAEKVETIDPLGQPFDHDTAQAVQMVEDATKPDQTVTAVLQKGYVIGAGSDLPRVLRPAMVVVSTNPGN